MNVITLDMEIAVMEWCDQRKNIVVTGINNTIPYLRHECDVLKCTKSGYLTEIEIKVSRADLKKDKLKRHGHVSKRIKQLYFAVPEKLAGVVAEHVPPRSGILVVKPIMQGKNILGYRVTVKRKAAVTKSKPLTAKEMAVMDRLGRLRVLGLKKKLRKMML